MKMFNQEEYMETVERDYDYYLFWAEELMNDHNGYFEDCRNLLKTQIRCSHLLMDLGQQENYQEDGFILGEIIWENIKGGE
jgi:hypothetical protein